MAVAAVMVIVAGIVIGAVGLRQQPVAAPPVHAPGGAGVTPAPATGNSAVPDLPPGITAASPVDVTRLRTQFAAAGYGIQIANPASPQDRGYTGALDAWNAVCTGSDFPSDTSSDPLTVVYATTASGMVIAIVAQDSGPPLVYAAPPTVSAPVAHATSWCDTYTQYQLVPTPGPTP